MNPGDAMDSNFPAWAAYNSGGLRWFNGSSGATIKNYVHFTYPSNSAAALASVVYPFPEIMGKSLGLGDVELLTDVQPIEIGNRIWQDTNGNGIQDAGETAAGVATGTTVTLRSPGVDGIYGNADDQTWTTTTDAAGNYYFNTLSSADNRMPASWTAMGTTILPGYDYRVEIAIPANFIVTQADVSSNTFDNIDNDAVVIGSNAVVLFNTGNTNHNFDIGLINQAVLAVQIVSFNAAAHNNAVKLNWKVAQQIDISTYTVEYSTDGNNFSMLQTVAAADNTTDYQAIHSNPVRGLNYYRLKVLEQNGQFSYSEIRKINFTDNTGIMVYPLPAKSIINISLPAGLVGKPALIFFADVKGRNTGNKYFASIRQIESIDVSSLVSGVYYLHIRSDETTVVKTIQLIK